MKKSITIFLLLFVVGSLLTLFLQNNDNTDTDSVEVSNVDTNDSTKPENRLIVYYLHGNVRCQTCEKLEAFSKKAITENYSVLIENGSVEFIVLNYDEPANAHFLTDFDISFQSLVVVDMKENKNIGYENLAKIWDLTHDEEAYINYVQANIDAHIGAVL